MKSCLLFIFFLSFLSANAQIFEWSRGPLTPPYSNFTYPSIGKSNCVDDHGNIFAAGDFVTDSLFFESDTLISTDPSIFLAKYDSNGNHVWAKGFSSTIDISVVKLWADLNGNLFMLGEFQGTLTIDTFTESNSSNEFFVVKFDSSGACLWVRTSEANYSISTYDLAIDGAGSVYIVGSYMQTLIIQSDTLYSPPDPWTGYGARDGFIAKFSSDGLLKWILEVKGDEDDFIHSVCINNHNEIFIAGNSSINAYIDTIPTLTYYQAFISKIDTEGQCLWVTPFFSNNHNPIVGCDTFGNAYGIVGSVGSYIYKFDNNGNVMWMTSTYCLGAEFSSGGWATTDFNGNTIIASRDFYYDWRMLIGQIDSNGVMSWIRQATVLSAPLFPSDVVIDNKNHIFLSGFASRNSILGNTVLPNSGFFLSKMSISDSSIITVSPYNYYSCEGGGINGFFSSNTSFNADNFFVVELSDSAGSFSNAMFLDTIYSFNNYGYYGIALPDTLFGSHFKIRVSSSSPPIIGLDNGFNYSVIKPPFLNFLITDSILCSGDSSEISISGPQVYFWYNADTLPWQFITLTYDTTLSLHPAVSTKYAIQGYNYLNGNSGECLPCPSSKYFNIYIDVCTDILEPSKNTITIFPNPTDGVLRITSKAEVLNLKLRDVTMNDICLTHNVTFIGSDHIDMDVSFLPKGIYFLSFDAGGQFHTAKIILN